MKVMVQGGQNDIPDECRANEYHVSHCSEVHNLEKNKRNKCIKLIKKYGLSKTQTARLTGVSRGIILKKV